MKKEHVRKLRYDKKVRLETLATAINHRQQYTVKELEIALDKTIKAREAARLLGRSVKGIQKLRYKNNIMINIDNYLGKNVIISFYREGKAALWMFGKLTCWTDEGSNDIYYNVNSFDFNANCIQSLYACGSTLTIKLDF